MKKNTIIYGYLTFLGTIPFIASALLIVFDIKTLPILGSIMTLVEVYGLVIASFMAGIHWGQKLSDEDKGNIKYNLLFPSNAIAITLWLSYITTTISVFLMTLILLFIILLWIDTMLYKDKMINAHYFLIRCSATTLVVASLIVIIIVL